MQSFHWCFTHNNPRDIKIPGTWPGTKYVVWQLEKGENLTPHLQGYVSFARKKTLAGLKKKVHAEIHWEIAKGSAEQNTKYCTKEEGRVEGPWFKGAITQGKRTDLGELKKLLDSGASLSVISRAHIGNWIRYSKGIRDYIFVNQIHRSHDETTYGLVLYGAPGTGKSFAAATLAGTDCYVKPANKWWSDYTQQKVVICEEFYGYLSPHMVLRLLDHGPLILETKGGHTKFNSKEVIFTCNDHPSTWWPNATISNDVRQALARRFKYFMRFSSPGVFTFEKPNFIGRPMNYAMFGNE